MKCFWLFILLNWILLSKTFGQQIQSGYYGDGLYIAYDSSKQALSGYYENYTGWDESLKAPRFSCVFFIEAHLNQSIVKINTYYPEDRFSSPNIEGQLEIVSPNSLLISLKEEHGGCWNVEHFTDAPVRFKLSEAANWKAIKYVIKDKAFFYRNASERSKEKAYLIKNNFFCIYKIYGNWAYGCYNGEHTKTGWIKRSDLNP
jgi:hypothetical protein